MEDYLRGEIARLQNELGYIFGIIERINYGPRTRLANNIKKDVVNYFNNVDGIIQSFIVPQFVSMVQPLGLMVMLQNIRPIITEQEYWNYDHNQLMEFYETVFYSLEYFLTHVQQASNNTTSPDGRGHPPEPPRINKRIRTIGTNHSVIPFNL